MFGLAGRRGFCWQPDSCSKVVTRTSVATHAERGVSAFMIVLGNGTEVLRPVCLKQRFDKFFLEALDAIEIGSAAFFVDLWVPPLPDDLS